MRILIVPLLAVGLAGCNQMATAPIVKPVGAEFASAPAGPGCAGQIARFKEILAYDLGVGRVHKTVYDTASAPISQAEAACVAGRSGEAMAILTRTKRASGYG